LEYLPTDSPDEPNDKKCFCILEKLKLEIAYEKTKIGRTSTKSFDFLGFNISAKGLKVSQKSVQKLAERIITKLVDNKESPSETYLKTGSVAYGQRCSGSNLMKGALPIPDGISKYVQRWSIWVKSIYGKENLEILETFVT